MRSDLSAEAVELSLYIENEAALYPRVKAIYKNLCDKKARGTYDSKRAVKIWKWLIDEGTKRYGKDFLSGGAKEGLRIFSPKVRTEVAVLWTKNFESDPEAA
jgi:hypothetical protein